MTIKDGGSNNKISLDTENIVLRGMSLRNTDYAIGIVIFTGHETKVMKNSAQAKYKKSGLYRKFY